MAYEPTNEANIKDDGKPKVTHSELLQFYLDGEAADSELFAEQRSNILLSAGEHYSRKNSKFWNKLRFSRDITEEQKVRLTKNHTHRITKNFINNIVTYAPGVTVVAKNENEIQDQKCAELNLSAWQHIKNKHKINEKIVHWASDYVEIGEVFIKMFWDPDLGELKGYEQEMSEEGMPMFDEVGNPLASKNAVFHGDLVFERIYGFNILRPKTAKSWDGCRWVGLRKMVPVEILKIKYKGTDQEKYIQESADQTFKVFEGTRANYMESKNEVLVMEWYFRPSPEFPQGYFFIFTKEGVLEEGELPLGIFPIKYCGWDEVQTSPRHRSIIKQLRPYQAEINRAASKIAEHQITLGDDKLLIQNGTKLSQGGILPGIRGITYSGMTPTIMAGRAGDQYLSYMQNQIQEMYTIAELTYDAVEKESTQLDPYSLLFQSMRNKKKYSLYAQKFENLLIEIASDGLQMAKAYWTDAVLIPAIGKREYINIPEFKSSDPMGYRITLLPQTDDVETKLGKQIMLSNLIQYAGQQLGPENIGKVIKMMPYANEKEIFDDLTLDYENSRNDILALDRGKYRPANENDEHAYVVKRLINRMKQPDFEFLPPQIQQMYAMKKKEHETILAQQQQQIQAAAAGFIPTGGYAVVCDIYVSDPKDPEKTRRARIPYEAMQWLLKKLETQGSSQSALTSLPTSAQADLANMISSQAQIPTGAPAQAGVTG